MPFLLASHKNKTAAFKLNPKRKEVTIGRDLSNDMPLPLSRISFAHACISYKGEHWYIRDLGSSNGTKVNNVRIKGKVQIKDGDRVRMGNVRMKFVDSAMIPDGVKRLRGKKDYTQRVLFKCKYCCHCIKAMQRDVGRRVQCHNCSQIVHIPGHCIGKHKKKKRPETPLLLAFEVDAQGQSLTVGQKEAINKPPVKNLDDLHDELADVLPQTTTETRQEASVDQAQAMKLLRQTEIKTQLFRDDRGIIEKLWCTIQIKFVLHYSKLKDPSFPIHRWHVAVPGLALVCFLLVNQLAGPSRLAIEKAPSNFAVNCVSCNHESNMTLDRFERLSFFMMHPENFDAKYPNDAVPKPSVCETCRKAHVGLRLVVDPDTGNRQIVALTEKQVTIQVAKAK